MLVANADYISLILEKELTCNLFSDVHMTMEAQVRSSELCVNG